MRALLLPALAIGAIVLLSGQKAKAAPPTVPVWPSPEEEQTPVPDWFEERGGYSGPLPTPVPDWFEEEGWYYV